MITINNIERTTLKYHCDCGVSGQCMFKAPDGEIAIVIDVQCPMCKDTERVKILRYTSEDERQKLLNDNADLHWAIVVDNSIREECNE